MILSEPEEIELVADRGALFWDSRIRRSQPHMDQRLHSETDLTISIFSSVIGKHMFADSPNA
jgi:hypothetical protein